ncbi:hypothetical protein D3C86_2152780 [compost metagenome]
MHVIIELDQLDLVALLFEDGHDALLELVDVRASGAADDQLLLGLGQDGRRQADKGHGRHGSCQQGTTHYGILHHKPL